MRLSGSVKLRCARPVRRAAVLRAQRPPLALHARRWAWTVLVVRCRRRGRLGLQRRLRRADAREPARLVGHPVRHLVAAPVGAMAGVLLVVGRLGPLQPAGHLGGQRGLGLRHAAVAHRLVARGVGLELGAVDGDVAEPDEARRPAEPQHLAEQLGERGEVAAPEARHGAEVRPLQPRHRHEIDPLLARPGDPARGVDAAAVAVEQQRHHHPRVVGRVAALLVVGREDHREVERLAHGVADEVREVPGRDQLVRRGRQQPALVHVPGTEGLRHPRRESRPPRRRERLPGRAPSLSRMCPPWADSFVPPLPGKGGATGRPGINNKKEARRFLKSVRPHPGGHTAVSEGALRRRRAPR